MLLPYFLGFLTTPALLFSVTQARPFEPYEVFGLLNDDSALLNASSLSTRAEDVKPTWLRILPLGASIVKGLRSDPEDGFRKPLRDKLRSRGHSVNMIGSQ